MKICPLCKSQKEPKFLEKFQTYRKMRCPDCDVVYFDPMKNPGAEWYDQSEMYAVGQVLHVNIGWHHMQFIEDRQSYGKRLLDVGCGPGAFLNEAQKKGYEVYGIDFGAGNIKTARERYGIANVFVKSVQELGKEFKKEKFDVVTFFEVLEHLDDPIQFLEDIKSVLKPKGYIALSLPNRDRFLDPLGRDDYPPNHLTKWNKASLISFLERNGFQVVKCNIKRFGTDDLAGFLKSKIRLGIAKGFAKRGIDKNEAQDIKKAASLLRLKDSIFFLLTIMFKPVFSIIKLQGTGLYVLARLK